VIARALRAYPPRVSSARRLLATVFIALAAVFLPSPASPLRSDTPEKGACSSGAIAAVIGGKRTCLKPGRPCKTRLDRQYRRYGFKCYRGRLIRLSSGSGSQLTVRRIDVGGYRLAIRCQGKGKPTIILESGFDNGGNAWFLVQPKAARTTRVCSYDRAGLGASDPRKPPGPPPASRIVEELHTLCAARAAGCMGRGRRPVAENLDFRRRRSERGSALESKPTSIGQQMLTVSEGRP
jgi:hypothetical protein